MIHRMSQWIGVRWRLLLVVLTPIVLLPIPLIGHSSVGDPLSPTFILTVCL